MFTGLAFLGLSLGLDSFAVGIGLGAAAPEASRHRWRLACAFGLCDGLASFLGSLAGMDAVRSFAEASDWLGPIAVAVYGLFVLCLAFQSRRLADIPRLGTWGAFVIPVCVSLDNFVVGVGPDASTTSAGLIALGLGVVSGCLALLGMYLGSALARRVTGTLRAEWLGGSLLILVAVALMCKELLF